MRHVQRGDEPKELAEFKAAANADWTPTYRDLPGKTALGRRLAREQGDLCGYCGGRIGMRQGDCHIEHVEAQSTAPHRQLDHTNMLASCMGSEATPPVPEHCGAARGNTKLSVHPFMPDCGTYFSFGSDGSIGPSVDPAKKTAAEDTIQILRLDTRRLNAARAAAIAAALEGIADEPDAAWLAEAATYDVPGDDGRLVPYCFAIRVVLLREATRAAPAP